MTGRAAMESHALANAASEDLGPAAVLSAARLLNGVAVRTPLLESKDLNERAGRRILIKFEGLQHTGSFKFRGAYNRLARLDPADRARGVVAYSSGNHGQAIAAVAQMLGMAATIVMPADAPAMKIEKTRARGAEVVLYDRNSQSREEIASSIAANRGAVLDLSFNDPLIIAGQGTIGVELIEQARDAQTNLGQLLVGCGGGGLIAGVSTYVKSAEPAVEIYSVEPLMFNDTARSLESGQREVNPPGMKSICDALLAPMPGELSFSINQRLLSGGLAVTDEEVRAAMRYAFDKLKLVAEPGGAVSLAAILAGRAPPCDGDTAIVISGSNVDPDLYASILSGAGE